MRSAFIPAVRTATGDDAPALSALLAEAFLRGDLGPWLVPDLDTRAQIYRSYFALVTEHALDHGRVEVTGDRPPDLAAAAVWYRIEGGPAPAAADYDARLALITGPSRPRFVALDDAMHRHHPYHEQHHYLAFLAVLPERQCHGLGSALLAHHHAVLDTGAAPAYLEATGPRNARLYARHGYRPRPPYRVGGDGPELLPMWRPPTRDNPAAIGPGA